MRRLADAPLRRGKAERGAHRSVEKGVGLDCGRPDRFVEARQKHAIEAQETRFEQTEDLRRGCPPLAGGARAAANASSNKAAYSRKRSWEALDRRLAPFVHELRQLLEPVRVLRRAVRSRSRGGDRSPMLSEAIAQGSGGAESAQGSERACDVARERFRRPPVGLADAVDRGMRMSVSGGLARRREGPLDIVERRKRDGAKDGELQRARRGFHLLKRAPEAGCWVR